MKKVFEDFGLKSEHISNVVTDGCSAFAKAIKVYGKLEPLISTSQTIEEYYLNSR